MKNPIIAIQISVVLLLGAGLPAQANVIDPDLQTLLDTLGRDDEVNVLVTLTDQVDIEKIKDKAKSALRTALITELKDKKDKTQQAIKDFLKGKALKITSFWIFNGLAVTTTKEVIIELAKQPGIENIRLDDILVKSDFSSAGAAAPEGAPAWNLNTIRAPELWALGYTGAGIVVAGMDTGVDAGHADLSGRWRGGSNSWYDPNGEHATPYDYDGHGTRVMGVMVGGDATGTAIGVAPGAQWIAVKIFNDVGVAEYSDIHLGFQWLLDPDDNPATNDAPDVVNNSWGFRELVNQCFTEFQPDIQALKTAEIAVVFSAGNEGPYPATTISPANYPESFAVGAVDEALAIASSSSRGPSACDDSIYPEAVAPGVNIKTSDLSFGGVFPNSYAYVSGTSFAAPHLAGAMALLLNANFQATVLELDLALTQSAVDLGLNGPDYDYGNGLVDVVEAYLLLGENPPQCTNADSDGYYAEAGCGTAQDCDDTDATIYPGAPEIMNDGIDQDCDGTDLTSGPACTDADNDGYYVEADCGEALDCNDTDATIYPSAPETKHDGIDQNCNGYDLTIDIAKAAYTAKKDTLSVEASSVLGSTAALELVGFGSMKWNRKNQKWTISIRGAGGNPGTVTVQGVEGAENADVR